MGSTRVGNRSASRRQVQIAVSVFLAMFMAFVDGTVVNLALPSIQQDLHADFAGLQWVVDGYIVVLAALLLLGGVLGDRYGLKRLFLGGVTVFIAGSLVCAVAPGIGVLIAGRAVQGLGAAMFLPGTLAILTRTFSEPRQRAQIIGLWSAVAGLSMAVGPVLGGALINSLGWPSVFYINLPLSAVVVLLGVRAMRNEPNPHREPLDLLGQALAIGWLVALTFGLIESTRLGWGSPVILGLLAAAAVLFAAFLFRESRAAGPMLPLRLFRDRTFATCCFLVLMVGFGLIGTFFFLSLFLQNIQHNSPLGAGLRLLPAVLTVTVVAPFAGRMAGRFGSRYLVTAGMSLVGLALLLFNLIRPDTPYSAWWPLLALLGAGVGLTQSPTMAALMGSVRPQQSGLAAATGNTCQQIGGVLSVALLSSIVSVRFSSHLAEHAPSLPDAVRERLVRSVTTTGSGSVGADVERLVRESFVDGLHGALTVAGVVYLVGALAAVVFLPSQRGDQR